MFLVHLAIDSRRLFQRGFQRLRKHLALLFAEQILERIHAAAEALVQTTNGGRQIRTAKGFARRFAQIAVGVLG